MNRLEAIVPPFDFMTPESQLAFVRKLRSNRLVKKIRPAEAKATKRVAAKKHTKVVELLQELTVEERETLLNIGAMVSSPKGTR